MNIWALEKSLPDSSVNNICASLRFSGAVTPEAVAEAAAAVAADDAALRTRIRVEGGTPLQYISDEAPEIRFGGFSGTTEEEYYAWADAEARKPFFGVGSPLCVFSVCPAGDSAVFLFIKLHHLICDGYSAGDLCRRIAQRTVRGSAYAAPERYAYADFIESERKYLSSDAYAEDREYWEQRLALPSEAAAAGTAAESASRLAERVSVKFSPSFLRKLSDFCSDTRLSPFIVFFGALAEYLHRAGSADRLTVGVPVINRRTFAQKNTMGMFVSTVPFICEVKDSLSFDNYLLALDDDWTDAMRHRRFPFSEMRGLGGEGGASFRTMLSFQPDLSVGEGTDDVSVSGKWHFSGCQEEQLCIHLTGSGDSLAAEYDYCVSELSGSEVLSIHSRVCRLIENGIDRPGDAVYSLGMSDGDDVSALYGEAAAVPESAPYGLVSAVGADVPAVICGGRTLTYGELCAKARVLASEIGNGGPCAVALGPGEGIFVAMTAAMYAGCAWMTVAPGLPAGRIGDMLRKSGAVRVITDKPLPEGTVLPEGCEIIDYTSAVSGEGRPFVPRRQKTSDIAYEVFTSGSTGTPKGVAISVGSLCNLACAMKSVYPDRPLVSVCNPGFDAFIIDSAAALMNGRTVIMTSEEERGNPRLLAGLIEKYGAGMISLTPSRLSALLDSAEFGRAAAGLERIICGGEPFGTGLIGKIRARTSARVFNQYGPSEAAVAVSMSEVAENRPITAGKPFCNCSLYVMDGRARPLPRGMKGELYIGGVCVGEGYVNEPELTSAAFVTTDFGRLYKTGDLAYVDGNGDVVICGRRDGQVKIRGLRVELQEIVSRISSFGGVTGAAAKVAEIAGQKVIIGYYTSADALPEREISAYCAEYLPEYMIPARIIRVGEIPLTANGKTDAGRLPVPETDGCGAPPANARQELLLGIFRDVLGHTDIYADSSYFLCGGNSLNAMETLRRIADETGISLTVSALYACRTAEGLDAYMSSCEAASAPAPSIEKIFGAAGYVPMTPTQENIYLSASMDKSGRAYQMPCVLDTEKIDFDRFVRAFDRFAEDEPLFRASFVRQDGRTVMKISEERSLFLRIPREMSDDGIISELTRPFDLSSAPLFRIYAKRTDNGCLRLFINVHHIIADGLTVNLLLDRLGRFYDGAAAEPHLSLADLSLYCQKNGEADPADVGFWKKELAGCPEYTDIPDDSPRPSFPDFRGAELSAALDAETDSAARTLLRRYGLTPYALFCGVFGLLFGKLGGEHDTVIGTPVHGRTLPGTENIAGPLMKVLPVRLRTRGTVSGYFGSVMATSAALSDHSGCSAADIAEALGIKAKPGAGPLYRVLFQTRPVDTGKMNIGSIGCVYSPIRMNTSKLDLSIEAADEGVFRLYFEYASSVFDEATVRMMASSAADIIKRLASLPPDAPAEDAVMPSPEAEGLIADSFTETSAGDTRPLHEIISENARLRGDSTAVIFHGSNMSFAELERESMRIAGLLRRAGVGRGDKVGVVCRRTPLMLAALIAVLRRGAAYVPFLTTFPHDRAAYMMETAGAKAVLRDGSGAEAFPGGCFGVPCIDMEAACEPDAETVPVTGADPIYVLFTSGSTGRPKGVQLPHRALTNLYREMHRLWKGLDGPVLCSTNMTFDIFGTESLIALADGHAVLLADDSQMVLAHELAGLIRGYRPDIAQFTPSKLAMCLRNREFADSVSGLRFTILVGENVPPSLVSDFSRSCGGRLVNMYGPTEAAVYVTAGDLTAGEQVTIGTALGGCRLYVLDEDRRHCLPGARGELWLAGVCLADGYISRPDLTEKVFVPDPFFPGERMYRTGDIARMRADGRFECFGRNDNQIKINGNRVEPGEIDEALLAAGAAGAVTVVKKNPDGSSVLETVVTPESADTEKLLSALGAKLPKYMVPSKLRAVKSIPINASGKADVPLIKKLLDSPENGPSSARAEKNAPTATAEEARLLKVWSAVLGREDLRPDVSFFEQGGSSLTALNVISEYSNLGIAMTLEEFYSNPTASAQAVISGGGARLPAAEAEPVKTYGSTPAVFPAYTARKTGGGIFVTGASGFLGAHLLRELTEKYPDARIVCLTHEGGTERLRGILDAYFGEGFTRTHGISAVPGDVTLENLGMSARDYRALAEGTSTVVHCAADVRHYAADGGIANTNVTGTAGVAEFSLLAGADMLHVSTASISGNYITASPDRRAVFSENDFDIGQNRENRYISSKLGAEAEVYARMERGLRARVFRVGRLCGRYSDGVFQRNPDKNAFMRVVRGMRRTGAVPEELCRMPVELSPVDICAGAIVRLMDAEGTAFHPVQRRPATLGGLLAYLAPDAAVLGREEFGERLRRAAAEAPDEVSSFVDFCNAAASGRSNVTLSCERTHSLLAANGFSWPEDPGESLRAFRD